MGYLWQNSWNGLEQKGLRSSWFLVPTTEPSSCVASSIPFDALTTTKAAPQPSGCFFWEVLSPFTMEVSYKWKTLPVISFNLLFLYNINLSFCASATGLQRQLWDGEMAFLMWFSEMRCGIEKSSVTVSFRRGQISFSSLAALRNSLVRLSQPLSRAKFTF